MYALFLELGSVDGGNLGVEGFHQETWKYFGKEGISPSVHLTKVCSHLYMTQSVINIIGKNINFGALESAKVGFRKITLLMVEH